MTILAENTIEEFVVHTDENKALPMTWDEYWRARHVMGNKLPRGTKFDIYRKHMECKNASLGKIVLGSIRSALSQAFNENHQT